MFSSCYTQISDNLHFQNSLNSIINSDLLKQFNFQYSTADEFAHKITANLINTDISLFHVNIRSLNKNYSELCVFLESLQFQFDIIVLSEIWNFNLNMYGNILKNYTFYHDIPKDSNVGGIGVYIKDSFECTELSSLKINNSLNNRVENLWFEISRSDTRYRLGCIYRHPNQNVDDFSTLLHPILNQIRKDNIPCIITGDVNIDLCKFNIHSSTTDYVHNLLVNLWNKLPENLKNITSLPAFKKSLRIFLLNADI